MFTPWDIALIAVVSVMGAAIATVRHPEHKAFVLMLPVPFTLAASESLMRVQTAVEASARELER